MFAVALSRTTRHRLFVCLLLLSGLLAIEAGVLPASAQPSSAVEADTTTRNTVSRTAEQKSVGRAVTYSLGGTLGPLLVRAASDAPPADMLLVAGLLAGPSIGHLYAQKEGRALINILTRGAIAGVGILSFIATFNPVLLTLGGLLFAGHAIYDIATTPRSVREYNDRSSASFDIAPAARPRSGQVGLSLQIQL